MATTAGSAHWSASLWSWGLSLALATLSLWKLHNLTVAAIEAQQKQRKRGSPEYRHGFTGLIGDTPLLELTSLSKATGCTILVLSCFSLFSIGVLVLLLMSCLVAFVSCCIAGES